MKKRIRLTESQLVNMIKKAVKRVLKEQDGDLMGMENKKKWPHDKDEVLDAAFYKDVFYIVFGHGDEETDYQEFDIEFELEDSGKGGYEAEIVKVKEVTPLEKKWDKWEFIDYMEHLGLYEDMIDKKTKDLGDSTFDY